MPTIRFMLPLVLFLTLCCAPALFAGDKDPLAVYVSDQGQRLTARFDIPGKKVRLVLPGGKTLTLPQAMSGSGARYSNGAQTFWEHQGSAIYEEGETLLFEGRETPGAAPAAAPPAAPERDAALRSAAGRYAAELKRTDKTFAEEAPAEPFPCMLDAGKGKPPVDARCVNVIDAVTAKGELASVRFAVVPVEGAHKKLPVMADGGLVFLLRKDKAGEWRGAGWFLDSDAPSLNGKQRKASGLSAKALESVGWLIDQE